MTLSGCSLLMLMWWQSLLYTLYTHTQYDQEQPPREILNTQNFWFRNSWTTKLLGFERTENVFDWHTVQCYVQFHFDIFSVLFSSLNQSPKNLVQLQCVCWLGVCAMPLGKHLPIRNWKEHISSWVRKIFLPANVELSAQAPVFYSCVTEMCVERCKRNWKDPAKWKINFIKLSVNLY